jgi:hypothetical protein
MPTEEREKKAERSEFMASLRWGALIGLALLVVIVPSVRMAKDKSRGSSRRAPGRFQRRGSLA